MSEKSERKITFPRGGGLLQDITLRVKLVVRLMSDSRVNLLLKLVPVGSLAYLVMPDLLPLPFDDAAIIGLATYLFVELCPPDVVQEHLDDLTRTKQVLDRYGANQPQQDVPWATQNLSPEGEIVEGTVIEKKGRQPG